MWSRRPAHQLTLVSSHLSGLRDVILFLEFSPLEPGLWGGVDDTKLFIDVSSSVYLSTLDLEADVCVPSG